MKIGHHIATLCLCMLIPAGFASSSAADYLFTAITANNPDNVAIGESQLSMSVSDLGGSVIQFDFFNAGPDPATIELIAFDGDLIENLLGLVQDDNDVAFDLDDSPGNLPGGNSIDPAFSADFSASASSPAPHNGLNPGETLGIIASLDGGTTFAQLLTALSTQEMRVGMHVISMGADGNSESFISHIPGPSSLCLLAAAAAISGHRRRSRHEQARRLRNTAPSCPSRTH